MEHTLLSLAASCPVMGQATSGGTESLSSAGPPYTCITAGCHLPNAVALLSSCELTAMYYAMAHGRPMELQCSLAVWSTL